MIKVKDIAYMFESDSIWHIRFDVYYNGFWQKQMISRKELMEEFCDRVVQKIIPRDGYSVMLVLE